MSVHCLSKHTEKKASRVRITEHFQRRVHLTIDYSVWVLRDTTSTTTDDRINQFMKEFDNLKWNFDQGINVQTWIIVHNMGNDIRQLGSVLDEISASGTIGLSCVIFSPNAIKSWHPLQKGKSS
jgi:hypothetical protein